MREYLGNTRDRFYLGLRSDADPEDLPEGFGQVVENLVLSRRGLRVRPPKDARLDAALGSPIWNAYPFQKADSTWAAVLAVGGAMGGIRQWDDDDNVTTDLSGAPTNLGVFDAPNTQFVRIGDYLFLKGAQDGVLRRVKLDGTAAEALTGAAQPTYSAEAKLSSRVLAAFTPGGLDPDTDYGTIAVTDYDFADAATAGTVTAPANFGIGWYAEAGVVETDNAIDPANPLHNYARMDEPGSQIATRSDQLIPVNPKVNATDLGTPDRYHTHFRMTFRYKTDVGLADSLYISMVALDGGGNPLAEVVQEYSAAAAGIIHYAALEFSFAGRVDETDIRFVGVRIKAGPGNTPGSFGPYISFIELVEFIPVLNIVEDGASAVRLSTPMSAAYFGLTAPPSMDFTHVPVGDQHLAFEFAADPHLELKTRVAIPFTRLVDGLIPRARLGLRSGANAAAAQTAAIVYTPELSIGRAANGKEFFFTDLSYLDPADREDVWYLDIHFTRDLEIAPGKTYNGQDFISIGPFTDVGNLTVGQGAYTYRLRERKPSGAGYVTSPTILAEEVVEPSVYEAQAQVVIPSAAAPFPENDSVAPGSPIELWRSGGALGALYYFVGVAPDGLADASGRYWSYDAATRTFYDNTPDQILQQAEILLDHIPPPASPDCIGEHAGRLVVCQGEVIYVGQATLGVETGMYFTETFDPSHPRWREMGWARRLTGAEGQSTRREPLAVLAVNERSPVATSPENLARSVVITRGAPFFLAGSEPPFTLTSLNFNLNVGAVNHRACALFDGLVFAMTSDGLRAFNLSRAVAASAAVEGDLNPDDLFLSVGLSSAALRESFLFDAPGRLLLAVPAPGSASVDKVYLLDARYDDPPGGAWTRHTLGRVTSGFTFRGDRDAATYVCDHGGQIYRWDGVAVGGDTAVRGGATAPIPVRFDSRNFGASDEDYRCQRLSAVLEASGNQAITISVVPDDKEPFIDSHPWNLVAGENLVDRMKIDDQKATGRQLKYRVTGNITTAFFLRSVSLHMTPHRAI